MKQALIIHRSESHSPCTPIAKVPSLHWQTSPLTGLPLCFYWCQQGQLQEPTSTLLF